MISVDVLFRGKSEAPSHSYLKWDRSSALADFIVRQAGTLEVPISFVEARVEFLPDTMPRFPRTHDRYYMDGGTHWPDRYIITRVKAAASSTDKIRADYPDVEIKNAELIP